VTVYTPDHSREQDEVDARVKANSDIRYLARLVRAKRVWRKGPPSAITRQVDDLLSIRRVANPTIRPNAKKARKRRK